MIPARSRLACAILAAAFAASAAEAQQAARPAEPPQVRLGEAALATGGALAGSEVGWISRQAELIVTAEDEVNAVAGAFGALYGAAIRAPSDRPTRRLALAATATNLNSEPRSSVHGIYVEAVRGGPGARSGRAGDAIGLEVQAANLAPANPINAINPYENLNGRTYGLLVGSGGDVHARRSDRAGDADTAITVDANPMRWNQGLVFRHDALGTQHSPLTGRQSAYAMELAKDHQITWWDNTGGVHEAVALAGRPGGDFETVVERDMETRVGGRHRTMAGGYVLDLSEEGLRIDGPRGRVLRVGAETVMLDPAILPRGPEGLPVGGVWLQQDRDGQGTLRIRLR